MPADRTLDRDFCYAAGTVIHNALSMRLEWLALGADLPLKRPGSAAAREPHLLQPLFSWPLASAQSKRAVIDPMITDDSSTRPL